MTTDKILKTVEVILQNETKIKLISYDEGTFKFSYKNYIFETFPYTTWDTFNSEVTEYSFKVYSQNNTSDEYVKYDTEQKGLWTQEAKSLFESLYVKLKEKHFGLDKMFEDIFNDLENDDLIGEGEIPF